MPTMTMPMMTKVRATPAQDGAGVNIQRIAGDHQLLDPFLMVDEIRSDQQDDYMAGFPPHPHRGFETITYLLSGRMKHQDHLGNEAIMTDGGVQWLTAGGGVIHSEMPEQTEGLFHGFQIWLNLPSELKMTDPDYRGITEEEMTTADINGLSLKLITGQLTIDGQTFKTDNIKETRTHAMIADLRVPANRSVQLSAGNHQKLMVYVYDGDEEALSLRELGIYLPGEATLTSGNDGLRALVLAGEPLQEPVVQYGPFVMNSQQQIEQALNDYSSGRLTTQGGSNG